MSNPDSTTKARSTAWIAATTAVMVVLLMGFVILNRTGAADMRTQEHLVDMNRRLMDVEKASATSLDTSMKLWTRHERLATAVVTLHEAEERLIVGKVQAADIEANTYMLTIGSDDGVREAQRFSVRRAGDEITQVKITGAGKETATAAGIAPNAAPRIQRGDVVVLVEDAPAADEER